MQGEEGSRRGDDSILRVGAGLEVEMTEVAGRGLVLPASCYGRSTAPAPDSDDEEDAEGDLGAISMRSDDEGDAGEDNGIADDPSKA